MLHQSKSIGSLTCPGLIYDTWVYSFELLKRQTDKKLGAMPWRFYKTLPEWQVQIGPTCAYRSAVSWWISYWLFYLTFVLLAVLSGRLGALFASMKSKTIGRMLLRQLLPAKIP
jgi:hypothetical protein